MSMASGVVRLGDGRRNLVFGVVAVVVAVLGLMALAATASAANPETDKKRGPGKDAGHFLGHPTPTYSWHGCTKTSTRKTPTVPVAGVPPVEKGSSQGKVKWTLKSSAKAKSGWVLRWKVKKKWTICGVQVAVRGASSKVDTDLVMQAGYKSGKKSGSTVKSGNEKIKVKISKKEASMGGLDKKFGGKKYKIRDIYSVTVFVKKK